MSSLFGIGAGSASTGFYPETIDQSARFNDDDNAYLNDTSPQSGNRRTFTISFWFKRSTLGTYQALYSAGTTGNYFTTIYFYTNDVLYIQGYASSITHNLITTQVFRDTTNWYHMVIAFDTTQATASNRIKLYINGSQVTSFDTETYPSQNHETFANSNITNNNISIGAYSNNLSASTFRFDGYLAEYNLIDGTALTPSSFGETKNGVWIPKAISGLTYGTSGFRLTFADSSNLGDDTSGNGNDFAVNGLASTDVMPDSPTNSFAVLNPLAKSSGITLAEGNLKWSSGTYNYQGTTATIAVPTSGKWYFECLVVTAGAGTSHDFGIGLVSNTDDSPMGSQINNNTFNNGAMYVSRGDSGSRVMVDGSTLGGDNTLSVASGGIMQCAFDADSGKIWFGEDNNWYDSSYSTNTTANAPSAGANQTATIDANHQYVIQFNGYTNQYVAVGNFGADSSFAGNKTSGSANATDGKYGDFYYTPPTGFLALCTANLPDTTLSPNKSEQADDYFGAIIYDGSASNQTITLNFQADWLWFKERTTAGIQPQIFDSSRGHATSGAIFQSRLEPNGVLSETDSVAVQSQSGNDLVLLGGVSTTNDASGRKYVMWHWRAGGSTPTKTYKVKVVADSTDYGHGTGSNKYQFFKSDGTTGFGTNGVDIDVQEGGTYIFDWSDSSAQGHPIRFSLTNDGTHSSGTSAGSEYTTGVVKDDSNYKTTITIQSGVASLYLYCANHAGMGFEVKTNISHGSSNFDGDIVSVVQTSDTAKFSMLTFTGNGTNGSTIGHGLGVKPAWYIVKDRDTNSYGHWMVWHKSFSDLDNNLFLNLENAVNNAGFPSGSDPTTSTTINPATTLYNNNNGSRYIAYVFAEVEGYSKMGHYIATGTSGDSAPFVYTGFRPAFVMVKNSSSSSYADWVLFDNKRDPENIVDEFINISTEAEFTGGSTYPFMDFLSNGFKLRLGGTGSQVAYAVNRASGDRYIYIAFAEQPFHLSNAR